MSHTFHVDSRQHWVYDIMLSILYTRWVWCQGAMNPSGRMPIFLCRFNVVVLNCSSISPIFFSSSEKLCIASFTFLVVVSSCILDALFRSAHAWFYMFALVKSSPCLQFAAAFSSSDLPTSFSQLQASLSRTSMAARSLQTMAHGCPHIDRMHRVQWWDMFIPIEDLGRDLRLSPSTTDLLLLGRVLLTSVEWSNSPGCKRVHH